MSDDDSNYHTHPTGETTSEKRKPWQKQGPRDQMQDQLEKLMKRVDKPVVIERQTKGPKGPVDFVRNISGSSAGAGSGDFHVYRALRRKELARQKEMDMELIREQEEYEFEQKRLERLKKEEEKTDKRRKKRLKRKRKGAKSGDNGNGDGNRSGEDDSDNENDNNNDGDGQEQEPDVEGEVQGGHASTKSSPESSKTKKLKVSQFVPPASVSPSTLNNDASEPTAIPVKTVLPTVRIIEDDELP